MADRKSRNISNLPLVIPDVPDAVTIASATDVGTSRAYNNGAATVTFSSPTGGLPSSYSITTTPSTTTTTATSSPATITGLASATSYTATITPSNVSATGPTATSSAFTATTIPQAPTIGAVTDLGTGGAITVAFTGNATGGKTISTYTATSSPGSITGSSATSPITVSGLTDNTAYTFTVTATNANGVSSASSASASVTPTGPAFEPIATATGTGSSGTITFSSIPSTYQHLQIRATCLSATAGAYVGIRFNSDSGTNYTRHSLWGTGAAVNAGNATSATEIRGYSLQTGTSNVNPNVMIFDVLDYASTSKNKTTRMIAGIDANGSGDLMLSSSLWLSTSAINRIDCILFTANYSTTTTFALYGIKGA